jgi:antitoxin Phd
MTGTDWQLQEAKARLSELLKSAQQKGPQQITVHGKPAAVVLSCTDYDRLTMEKPSFLEFMKHSPLKGIKLPVKRDKSTTRDVAL